MFATRPLTVLVNLLVAGTALVAGPAAAADDAKANNKPLADSLSPRVEACRSEDSLTVPLRTSGVDVVPLAANGYALETQDDSPFADAGLDVTLVPENDIARQVQDYLSCDMPIMRGTQGMINAVADLTENDERTRMVGLYQHGFSNGGDALVVRPGIDNPADLSGATLVTQAQGPHLSYMNRILSDARKTLEDDGGTWQAPDIRYTEDLRGLGGDTPASAFLDNADIDAAFVIAPDARVLTSDGTTGTGAEGSVKGAQTLLSTRSANRVISEVYVVRADYLEANPDQVRRFVDTLFSTEESVREDVVKQIIDWGAVGQYLLDDAGATQAAEQMWGDVETAGLQGNIDWANPDKPRSWKSINDEIQSGLVRRNLMQSAYSLKLADLDYASLGDDLFDQRRASLPGFDSDKTTQVVEDLNESGDLDQKALIDFDIHFKPNQTAFPPAEYRQQFERVAELASTYGGAVISVEGHSDPLNYLRQKHDGASQSKLRSIRQATRNLSMNRAIAVRDAVMAFANDQGEAMDESQFVTLGHGISEPKTGMCGGDPCPPDTEAEWLSNMRVTFRMVNVEAEASSFTPANSW